MDLHAPDRKPDWTFTPEERFEALAGIDAGAVKAALGRQDLSPGAMRPGDDAKLKTVEAKMFPRSVEPPRTSPPSSTRFWRSSLTRRS